MTPNRRQVLTSTMLGAGAAATLPLGGLGSLGTAQAAAPIATDQAPYFYRFMHGDAQVTMVSDGPLPLGNPAGNFLGVAEAEITGMLRDNFLPTDNVVLEQNSPILNINGRLVLFDTGMGAIDMFGDKTGRLLKSMAEAGIAPDEIDAVVCTHGHIDHIGGIVSASGPIFPNAQIYINEADFDFWTDEAKLESPLGPFVKAARDNLLPVRDRVVFVKDEEEFIPGITAMNAPGHTVGHTIFMIDSGGKQLCFIGDLTHHQVLLVERPRIEFAYDTDPKQAADTRVRLLDMLAANRIPIMAYHFPWPGIGHFAKMGDGFRYVAQPMELG
ncbi:MAG: MBL fold metallo-hydrolase [Pseudomonadota bacterium]